MSTGLETGCVSIRVSSSPDVSSRSSRAVSSISPTVRSHRIHLGNTATAIVRVTQTTAPGNVAAESVRRSDRTRCRPKPVGSAGQAHRSRFSLSSVGSKACTTSPFASIISCLASAALALPSCMHQDKTSPFADRYTGPEMNRIRSRSVVVASSWRNGAMLSSDQKPRPWPPMARSPCSGMTSRMEMSARPGFDDRTMTRVGANVIDMAGCRALDRTGLHDRAPCTV